MPTVAPSAGEAEDREGLGYPARSWWLGVSLLGMVVGSLGPWAETRVLGTTLKSTSGVERYGWVVLVAAAAGLAAALFFAGTSHRPRPLWPLGVCAAAAVLGVGVALNEWVEIASTGDTLGQLDESTGWALHLTWLASASALLATVANLGEDTALTFMSTRRSGSAVAPGARDLAVASLLMIPAWLVYFVVSVIVTYLYLPEETSTAVNVVLVALLFVPQVVGMALGAGGIRGGERGMGTAGVVGNALFAVILLILLLS